MKVTAAVALVYSSLTHGAAVSVQTLHRVTFGPKNCVKLTRTMESGSCVISTDCEGVDISKTEFVFDCVGRDSIVRHSFGVGGFDTNEEFDTEIKCDRCEPALASDVAAKKPSPKPLNTVPRHARETTAFQARQGQRIIPVEQRDVLTGETVSQKEARAQDAMGVREEHRDALTGETERQKRARTDDVVNTVTRDAADNSNDVADRIDESTGFVSSRSEVARYGPAGCVSTWKNKDGCCMIRTNCRTRDISKYEFGLICVDKIGQPVRHVFGKDSFDREETFNTLIKCDKCLGLEDIPDALALNGEVFAMSKDIGELKDVMRNISYNVEVLNKEVFSTEAPSAYGPEHYRYDRYDDRYEDTFNFAAQKKPQADDSAKVALHHNAVASRVIRVDSEQQKVQNTKKGNLRRSHKKHHHEQRKEMDEDDDDDRARSEENADDGEGVTYERDGSDEVQDAVIRDDGDDSVNAEEGEDRDDDNWR